MKPESVIMNFRPTSGVDYFVQPSGAWILQTKHADTSLIVARKYLHQTLTNNHTISIVDVGHDNKAIDVVDTYKSIWSAMDVISVCLMRENARMNWIHVIDDRIVVGMMFHKHKIPYGLYTVSHGKLEMITKEMSG